MLIHKFPNPQVVHLSLWGNSYTDTLNYTYIISLIRCGKISINSSQYSYVATKCYEDIVQQVGFCVHISTSCPNNNDWLVVGPRGRVGGGGPRGATWAGTHSRICCLTALAPCWKERGGGGGEGDVSVRLKFFFTSLPASYCPDYYWGTK